MKKRWIASALGATVAVVGAALFQGPHLPTLAPPLTIHSGGKVVRLTLSPDGRLLADDTPAGQVLLYDTGTGQQKYAFAARTGRVVFSPDSRHLLTENRRASSTNPNGSVQVWDTATGAQLSRFVPPVGPGGAPDIAAISRDLRWAVVRGGAGYTVYGVAAGNVIKALPMPMGKTQAVFSPDKTLLAVSSGAAGTLHVWNTRTWLPIPTASNQASGVTGIRFSQDGMRLALGNKAGLAWWDTRTWKSEGRFAMPVQGGLTPGSYFFSSDSQSLLTNGWGNSVTLHQIDCGTGRETLTVPKQMVQHTSLMGNRAETAGLPGGVQFLYRTTYFIWDTRWRQELYQIRIPASQNSSLMGDFQFYVSDLSADGRVFAVGGSDDGVIRVWRLP